MEKSQIIHIAVHSANIGEGALVCGMQKMLKKDIQNPIDFYNEDRMQFTAYNQKKLNGEYFEWVNQNGKILLIGGGGMIRHGKHKNFGGLYIDGNLNALAGLKRPIVIYAVGENLLYNEKYEYGKELKELIQRVTENGGLFSVRKDESKKRLQLRLNDPLEEVQTIPDAGLYVPVTNRVVPQIREGKRNVVIQLAGDKILNRFKIKHSSWPNFGFFKNNVKIINKQIKALAEAMDLLKNKWDLNLILAPHITKDWQINGQFVYECRKISTYLERSFIDTYGILRGTKHAPSFFDLYKQADLVIGMRGHSAITSVGLNTPFIGLNTHPKLYGFLSEADMLDYCVDIEDDYLQEKIIKLADTLLRDPTKWQTKRDKVMQESIAQTEVFHKQIEALL